MPSLKFSFQSPSVKDRWGRTASKKRESLHLEELWSVRRMHWPGNQGGGGSYCVGESSAKFEIKRKSKCMGKRPRELNTHYFFNYLLWLWIKIKSVQSTNLFSLQTQHLYRCDRKYTKAKAVLQNFYSKLQPCSEGFTEAQIVHYTVPDINITYHRASLEELICRDNSSSQVKMKCSLGAWCKFEELNQY